MSEGYDKDSGQMHDENRGLGRLGEEELRSILESSQDGILIEREERIIYVNNTYIELFGFDHARELVGKHISTVVAQIDAERVCGYGRSRVLGEEAPTKYEFKGMRKDKSHVDVEAFVSVNSSPAPACIITFLRDISERKRYERLLATQKEAMELVIKGTDLSDILSLLASVVEEQSFRATLCSILLLDEHGHLHNGASPSLPESYLQAIEGLKAQPGIGTCSAAAALGTVVITPDIDTDPGWSTLKHLPLAYGLVGAWSMPLISRDGRVLGTIGTYFREPRHPHAFERYIVEFLAPTAAIAIERKQADEAQQRWSSELEGRVAERTKDLRGLVGKLVSVQEDERRRIAHNLHDQLGQQMTVLGMKIERILNSLPPESGLFSEVAELQSFARGLSSEVAFLARELRPSVLDHLGIVAALDQYVKQWSNQFNINAVFNAKRFTRTTLAPEIDTNIYRITQEGLNNVAKHAGATRVNILIESRLSETILIIEDDGIGFEADNEFFSSDGMGLKGMRERISVLQGRFEIESETGKGTTLYVTIPDATDDREGENE